MDKLFIVLAVVVVTVIVAIVVKLKKNKTKAKDISDANLNFLKKSEKGREILASIQLSQAELKRAKLDEDTAGTHERVIEIEKRILDLDREVTEARLHAESAGEKINAKVGEGKKADTENSSSDSGKNSSPIREYREGANNLGWWVLIWSIAILATAALCAIALFTCIKLSPLDSRHLFLLQFSWFTIPAGLGVIAIWYIMARLYIPTDTCGIAITEEGTVSVVKTFGKYSGTVNPGIFFPIKGINEFEAVPVSQQTMPINLTDENGDGNVELINHVVSKVSKTSEKLVSHISVGVQSTLYIRITPKRAHMALLNINVAEGGYKQALNNLLGSMLRAYVAKYNFENINLLRGKSMLIDLFLEKSEHAEKTPNDFSNDELIAILEESKNWTDIRDDWGVEVIDFVIDNLIFSKKDQDAWEQSFKAEQDLAAKEWEVSMAEVEVRKAEQKKQERIKLAEARKQELSLEGEGLGNQILVAMEASNSNGNTVLSFLNRRQKYDAVTNGANTILIDEGSGGNGALQGAGLAAGMNKFSKNKGEGNDSKKQAGATSAC